MRKHGSAHRHAGAKKRKQRLKMRPRMNPDFRFYEWAVPIVQRFADSEKKMQNRMTEEAKHLHGRNIRLWSMFLPYAKEETLKQRLKDLVLHGKRKHAEKRKNALAYAQIRTPAAKKKGERKESKAISRMSKKEKSD